jgi:ribonuclease Z
MEIVFLGTASMQPTKERNLFGILFRHGTENILIDCGEGIQRQFKIMGLRPCRLTRILISHWHGDHVYGLLGLFKYLSVNEYDQVLEIYGPKGIKKYVKSMLECSADKSDLKMKLHEVGKEGLIFENKEISISTFKLKHSTSCYGYVIREKDKRKINLNYLKKFGLKQHPLLGKLQRGEDIIWNNKKIKARDATILKRGKKISFILDTSYNPGFIKYIKDSDILVSEATYTTKEEYKAREYKHMTAKDSAIIAKKANVKKLILTHFSQRYKDDKEILNDAKGIFKNVVCAKDFMSVVA